MKAYNQYCAAAKALDVIGDRWTLLIIRELLIRGACRYTDLHKGLPGIATNLLADRLRELEAAGLVRREDAPPPIASTLFELTDRGMALEPLLLELATWGAPLLNDSEGPEVLLPHWLLLPLKLHLKGKRRGRGNATVQLLADGVPIKIELGRGPPMVTLGRIREAAALVEGDALTLLGFVTGAISTAQAKRRGLRAHGDLALIERLRSPDA